MMLILRKFSFRSCIVIIVFILIINFFLFLLLDVIEDSGDYVYNILEDIPEHSGKYPVLLWWTPFTGEHGVHKKCGKEICFFTEDRKYFDNVEGLLFYGSDFKPTDLPLPRSSNHDWALLHEESPKNNYLFSRKEVMELFNHTATFKRESDLPLTLQYLDSLESLTSNKFFVPTTLKNSKLNNLAAVLYVQSDCNTPSERDSYVKELQKYIKVDSYGKCLHNKDLPPQLSDAMSSMNSEAFLEIVSQYKFTLAFENAICEDYITEKLWRPLILGSIPVYYGSPTVKDWLPNPSSAIFVTDFKDPMLLASYLTKLNTNDTAYESHLEHKLQNKISNSRLLTAMKKRKWGINESHKSTFIDEFECLVCERVSRNFKKEQNGLPIIKYQAKLDHYGCPIPVSPISLEPDSDSWWIEFYNKARYEARALETLLDTCKNFTATDFYQKVISLLENEGNGD